MLNISKAVAMAGLTVLLGACGGSGDGGVDAGSSTAKLLPTYYTPDGKVYNSCSLDPRCSGAPAPFFAYVDTAPADGAVLKGVVRLTVTGNQMVNVELLPASGYTPRFGVFTVSEDKARAWLDLDTTTLPDGPLNVRISAFDVPAGQAGAREAVAMQPRTWNISNTAAPPAAFSAAVFSAPEAGAVVSGVTRLEVHGSGMVNVELLPASGYLPRYGVFNVSADKTVAWLDLDTAALPEGVFQARISAFNVAAGQPNAQEIVAMPARQWNVTH
jgi:hypothetical protein